MLRNLKKGIKGLDFQVSLSFWDYQTNIVREYKRFYSFDIFENNKNSNAQFRSEAFPFLSLIPDNVWCK